MSLVETYTALKQKNILTYDLLNWNFEKILKSIKRKISSKERYRCPWTIVVHREIHFPVFVEVSRAVRDYRTSF